jgi:hypothetical protein
MIKVVQTSIGCSLSWPGWQLCFDRIGDRWMHSLQEWLGTSVSPDRRFFISLEGEKEDAWPRSPAFQDLYLERISSDCYEVQLLGQAGKNHYSGAIRCNSAINVIDFDLAVRIQSLPTVPLAMSSYLCLIEKSPAQLPRWNIVPQPIPGSPQLTRVDHDQIAGETGNEVPLQLIVNDLQALKFEKQRATIRWKYQMFLDS